MKYAINQILLPYSFPKQFLQDFQWHMDVSINPMPYTIKFTIYTIYVHVDEVLNLKHKNVYHKAYNHTFKSILHKHRNYVELGLGLSSSFHPTMNRIV